MLIAARNPELLIIVIASSVIGWLYKALIAIIIKYNSSLIQEFLLSFSASLVLYSIIILIYDWTKKDLTNDLKFKKTNRATKKITLFFENLIWFLFLSGYDPSINTIFIRGINHEYESFRNTKTVRIFLLSALIHTVVWIIFIKFIPWHF